MTRARRPDAAGVVERDGVRVAWERFGSGEPAIVFVPTWSAVDSRVWKFQVPDLARRTTVVTFDPRGNGRSDRPTSTSAYDETEFARDILDVMDAADLEAAVLVGLSVGAQRGVIAATSHPDRVLGLVLIGPSMPLGRRPPGLPALDFESPDLPDLGWSRYNRHSWQRDYEGFLAFFFGQCLSEPHSSKPIDDTVEWGLQTDATVLALSCDSAGLARRDEALELAAAVRCPVLVIHGDDDHLSAHGNGAELAAVTGGRLATIAGGGHLPQVRDPVRVNLLIRDFVASISGRPRFAPARLEGRRAGASA